MGVASLSVSPPDTDSARYHLEVARDMMDKIRGEGPEEVTDIIFYYTTLFFGLLPYHLLHHLSASLHVYVCFNLSLFFFHLTTFIVVYLITNRALFVPSLTICPLLIFFRLKLIFATSYILSSSGLPLCGALWSSHRAS